MLENEIEALAREVHKATPADRTLSCVFARAAKDMTMEEALGLITTTRGDVKFALFLIHYTKALSNA